MRVKICGITNVEDARAAALAGADAIGLNFVAGPRQIDLDQADRILRSLAPLVTPVALVRLVDGAIASDLLALLETHHVGCVQLYGQLDPDIIRRLLGQGFKPLLVVRVQDHDFAAQVNEFLAACGPDRPAGVVLDAYQPGRLGGTGKEFHWPWVAQARQAGKLEGWPPLILAGGLTPDNVAQAIATARPWAVDVVTGVEQAPGKKDPDKMAAFVRAARLAG